MHVLITGGAGFIGSHTAKRLGADGHDITVVDNHSRERLLGEPAQLPTRRWRGLEGTARVRCVGEDIRSADRWLPGLQRVEAVVHCAAQVGVTSSLADPVTDAEINVVGLVQLLTSLAQQGWHGPFIFFSSNKVYGDQVNAHVDRTPAGKPYRLTAPWSEGIDESFPAAMDGLTPYGCAKRAAELYVLDAARRLGFPAYVLRCSCIYGPDQSGAEDQGWVSHIVRSRLAGRTIRIFGDGHQSRDLLYIDDLTDLLAVLVRGEAPGGIYNVGGGSRFARSVLEVVHHTALKGAPTVSVQHCPMREFDQLAYVTDYSKIVAATSWRPQTGPDEGIDRIVASLSDAAYTQGSSGRSAS